MFRQSIFIKWGEFLTLIRKNSDFVKWNSRKTGVRIRIDSKYTVILEGTTNEKGISPSVIKAAGIWCRSPNCPTNPGCLHTEEHAVPNSESAAHDTFDPGHDVGLLFNNVDFAN